MFLCLKTRSKHHRTFACLVLYASFSEYGHLNWRRDTILFITIIMHTAFRPHGYERGNLLLYKVADSPFHFQRDDFFVIYVH